MALPIVGLLRHHRVKHHAPDDGSSVTLRTVRSLICDVLIWALSRDSSPQPQSVGWRCPTMLGSEDPQRVGADHRVSSARRPELAVDVLGVLLDRLAGDAQQLGDLLV